eukprot:7094373-Pyramimonas_sp.AAC.1
MSLSLLLLRGGPNSRGPAAPSPRPVRLREPCCRRPSQCRSRRNGSAPPLRGGHSAPCPLPLEFTTTTTATPTPTA